MICFRDFIFEGPNEVLAEVQNMFIERALGGMRPTRSENDAGEKST
jgi:hypothetical protein